MADQITESTAKNPATNPAKIPADRLEEITEECCTLIRSYRSQMGLDYGKYDGGLNPVGRQGSWLQIRQRARLEFRGKYYHRRLLGGIFLLSHWSMGIPSRFTGELASKLADDLVGSDPFFACMPENIDDPDKAELSKQVERKVQQEISASNLQSACAQAIRDGLCEGERCVQLSWEKKQTTYPGSATVLVDAKGEPQKTPNDEYIYQFDDVLDVLVDAKGNFVKSLQAALQDGSATMPPPAPDGSQPPPIVPRGTIMESRLEKEPAFRMPQDPQWKLFDDLELTITHRNGLVADTILCEDFIFDIYQPRLELCPLMARSYDAPLADLEMTYPGSDYQKKLALRGTGAMSHAGQPIWENGEQLRDDKSRELMNVHETYYRCRVDKDSPTESWLFIVIDIINKIPLFVEYLGRMRMDEPPFVLVRGFDSVTTRAYGIGLFEKLEDKALAIDTFFNRLCLKSSKSGSVTWFHPDAFKETKGGAKIEIGGEQVYRAERQTDVEYGPNNPPVARVNLNEVDEYSRAMMEDLIGACQLEIGIVSAGDASAAHLNSSETATGIKNIERTGNTVQKSTEALKVEDLTKILKMATAMILKNMAPEEAKWTPHEDKLATLNRDQVNMLPRNVRLLLTKTNATEGIEVAQQVLQTLKEWVTYPPSIQKQLRPAFLKILKDFDVPDADELLHDPTPEELQAASEAQANASKIQDQFRAMLKDIGALTTSERAQVLAKFGVQADDPANVAKAQQDEAQQQSALKVPPGPLALPAPGQPSSPAAQGPPPQLTAHPPAGMPHTSPAQTPSTGAPLAPSINQQ
jgi:hypothetical protein